MWTRQKSGCKSIDNKSHAISGPIFGKADISIYNRVHLGLDSELVLKIIKKTRSLPDGCASIFKMDNRMWVQVHLEKKFINTSYLTDSSISFTLKLESRQNFCSNMAIRSSAYGKKNISDFPPCGSHFILIHFTY